MVLHMPWERNLGGPRVQLELAEEFWKLGHEVEKFDYYDAFPKHQSSRLGELFRPSFSVKAKAFVQANAHRFDIIDAHQGNLPFFKQELGFQGLLVARSVGLYAFYDEFTKQENARKAPQKIKTRLGNLLRYWQHRREYPLYPRSLQSCDLINIPNHDELAYIRDILGLGNKCVVFPFGLSQERQKAFTEAIQPVEVRLANKQVVFIGAWGPRKGSRDWGEIVMRVKKQVPEVRFLFLGTGFSVQKVLEDLHIPACDWIEIIPSYDSDELPKLLSRATVGAFPSYIEGFGFAVLEKLACGIATVAYDVPGPRETLRLLDESLLITAGNVEQFSHKLVSLLDMELENYSYLTNKCLDIASNFSWEKIAKQTLEIYYKFLEASKK
ncbi:glycosyltransferase family 4 protein [Nostoc sp.]|uniref:glycosyltransferase family 4 protein n=1 Tax=Nostoc sp. TaxID=1180 RepID=UPI002FFBC1F0